MKVLITGISGFLGINLTRYLLALGEYEVYGIDLVNFDYPEAGRIHFLQGDIRDRAAVQSLMPGMDYVVHCAAALPLYPPEEIYSTEVEGTHILLDEALKSGAKRFVHISSTAVYGVPDHHPLYETDEVVGVGPYGEAKIQAEAWCSRYREQGLYVSVIRPKSFVGPERLGVFAIFYAWAREGRNFPMIGDGKNRYQLLDVDDVCQAIVGCFHAEGDLANSTFNIGAAEYTTMKEDYQAVLDEAGFGKRIVCFPAGLVVFALKVLEKLKLSPLYPWIYETASKDSFVSIEKAQHQLGFAPKYSNKEAMIRNYRWYLAHYSEISKEKGVTHRVPWDEKILKIAKLFF